MNYKFLLIGINAKYIHSNPAIRSLKSFVDKELQPCVELVEYTINNRSEEILADIYKHKPNAIGFSVYIWNVKMVRGLIKNLGKLLPNMDIYLGGPEVSFESSQYLNDYPNVKAVILGEGENIFKELISKCVANTTSESDLSSVPGLLLRTGYTGMQEQVSMDDLPFLYQASNVENETNDKCGLPADFEHRIIYYESARGCPFRCSYCLSSIDKTTHFRSLNLVFKELAFFLKNEVKQVKFIDRTFNCDGKRANEIWQYLIDHDNGITNFHFEIAADILSNESIDILNKMRPGLVQLEIGVQTTNEETLKAINRPCKISHLSEIVEQIRKPNNVHIHLDLIAGLPYENYESFKKSFNDVFKMKPDQLQLGFLKVLNGAPIKSQVATHGIVYSEEPPYEVLCTKYISYDEILTLKNVEQMVETFYNSAQFTKSVPYMLSFFDEPFDLFDALGAYYEKNGLFVATPARSRRYDILLDFSDTVEGMDKEVLRELLTLDYYLREKPKAKPGFVHNAPAIGVIDYEHKDPLTGNFILH